LIVLVTTEEECNFVLTLLSENFYQHFPSEQNTEGILVGFDVEGKEDKASTIQLSTMSLACVFATRDLNIQGHLPSSLVSFLEDNRILKAGTACFQDALRIKHNFGVETAGLLDISIICLKWKLTNSYKPLKDLANQLVGVLNPPAPTNWEKITITRPASVQYAGVDAWLGFMIAISIFSLINREKRGLYSWLNKYKSSEDEMMEFQKCFDILQKNKIKRLAPSNNDLFKTKIEDIIKKNEFARNTDLALDNLMKELNHNRTAKSKPTKNKNTDDNGDDEIILTNLIK